MNTKNLKVTIIVSVYKDIDSLKLILASLQYQTYKGFDIIISEDGESSEVKGFINSLQSSFDNLLHLTQEDLGFRKTRALNQSIKAASDGLLIFIDGDCIPHNKFIQSHVSNYQNGKMAVGRRAELGPFFSSLLKKNIFFFKFFQNKFIYLILLLPLTLDKAKNAEAGIYSPLLHFLNLKKHIDLLGCNFSIHKDNLISINGFNEDYVNSGCGEDTDIGWRLNKSGIQNVNVKYAAIEYHLWHPVTYVTSQDNLNIYNETRKNNAIKCKNGLIK